MYCLKCKKDAKDLNVKAFMTKNNRYMLKSTCNVCKGKKSKFISKKRNFRIRLLIKPLFKNTNTK